MEQVSGSIHLSCPVAQGGPAGQAGPALAAAGDEDQHHMVAHGHVGDAVAHGHHPAHRFMAQGHGKGPDA